MSGGATITQGTTLTNPQALTTVEELRHELTRANVQLMLKDGQVHDMRAALQQMGQLLSNVVLAHMAKDAPKVARELDAIVARHVIVKDERSGGVH